MIYVFSFCWKTKFSQAKGEIFVLILYIKTFYRHDRVYCYGGKDVFVLTIQEIE